MSITKNKNTSAPSERKLTRALNQLDLSIKDVYEYTRDNGERIIEFTLQSMAIEYHDERPVEINEIKIVESFNSDIYTEVSEDSIKELKEILFENFNSFKAHDDIDNEMLINSLFKSIESEISPIITKIFSEVTIH